MYDITHHSIVIHSRYDRIAVRNTHHYVDAHSWCVVQGFNYTPLMIMCLIHMTILLDYIHGVVDIRLVLDCADRYNAH